MFSKARTVLQFLFYFAVTSLMLPTTFVLFLPRTIEARVHERHSEAKKGRDGKSWRHGEEKKLRCKGKYSMDGLRVLFPKWLSFWSLLAQLFASIEAQLAERAFFIAQAFPTDERPRMSFSNVCPVSLTRP
ncbi:hypothetical protein ARMSODRAFT_90233 [Armillaria solidipes]|uniref:Uncharacterized protein n=1 Tax=Armillaria solidipes TaxID=1076256 RepID=A0A2H3BIJ4_9AGAR|nr:hypothetical protein ARMSODRAFT_90233 [Armillaria solidipes]